MSPGAMAIEGSDLKVNGNVSGGLVSDSSTVTVNGNVTGNGINTVVAKKGTVTVNGTVTATDLSEKTGVLASNGSNLTVIVPREADVHVAYSLYGGVLDIEGTDAEAQQCAERIACECGQSRTANAWAVLNCPCTRILGLYSTEEAATTAAELFGSCSFAYRLDDAERDRLIAA